VQRVPKIKSTRRRVFCMLRYLRLLSAQHLGPAGRDICRLCNAIDCRRYEQAAVRTAFASSSAWARWLHPQPSDDERETKCTVLRHPSLPRWVHFVTTGASSPCPSLRSHCRVHRRPLGAFAQSPVFSAISYAPASYRPGRFTRQRTAPSRLERGGRCIHRSD